MKSKQYDIGIHTNTGGHPGLFIKTTFLHFITLSFTTTQWSPET